MENDYLQICPDCGNVMDEHWTSEGCYYSCHKCHTCSLEEKNEG